MADVAVTMPVSDGQIISGLFRMPPKASACFVMAHGAGAGMTHDFLASIADGLARRRVATLRYQFPFMERGSRRPDSPAVAHAAVRVAVAEARRRTALPLFAGGKSFGGRMTSQAQALEPLPAVTGLVFLGFPLHPRRKPSTERADHLRNVRVPMLFLQGTRDELADLQLLEPICRSLGRKAKLTVIEDADHSFHVRARSGRTDEEVRAAMADTIAQWMSAAGRTRATRGEDRARTR